MRGYVYVFPYNNKKDFNFSDASLPWGRHPINTLPPKYKYFVVQQFFRCESYRFTSK
jgi:hypothetical protein